MWRCPPPGEPGHGAGGVHRAVGRTIALAGAMLATSLVATRDSRLLPHLPDQVEARLDVLPGLPQELRRPRQPTVGCLCQDSTIIGFLSRQRDAAPGVNGG